MSFLKVITLSSWLIGLQSAQAGSDPQPAAPMQVTHWVVFMTVSQAFCSLHLFTAVEMQVTSCAAQAMHWSGLAFTCTSFSCKLGSAWTRARLSNTRTPDIAMEQEFSNGASANPTKSAKIIEKFKSPQVAGISGTHFVEKYVVVNCTLATHFVWDLELKTAQDMSSSQTWFKTLEQILKCSSNRYSTSRIITDYTMWSYHFNASWKWWRNTLSGFHTLLGHFCELCIAVAGKCSRSGLLGMDHAM